ncbi:SRPBCC family protein [Egicoccus halophilus]|uniref:Polyketide cyclase / dehydrase and lipid transport n=1 Tax=Egicoccus halophilus TaxID=1670830 RepID=A0A8J3AG80_9ACTN|nr:SRPBCC family protein [Egicoccus halophilus]GGI08645.1 hypothetical protein GCM10011354_30130 [Egicoccus halophilus]
MLRHLEVGRVMPGAPERAWRLLTDTRTWPDWGPTIRGVEVAEPRIGPDTTGRVRTLAGVALPFRVTDFAEGVRWRWRVAGVPATGHRVEAHPEGCRVVFEVPVLAAAYTVVCRVALHRIEQWLADGA